MKSDNVKKGVDRAPNKSLMYALGLTEEEISRPLIGVVSSYNEIVPGHMHLDKIAEAVKAGVRAAGGTPVLFPAIAVCDGIAMGHIGMKYSLVTRDLIADSTEAMAIAHQFDGLVMVPNCDKNVPGLLMAAARINVPTIFCAGGPMLAGRLPDGRRTCLSHMFEAVGAYHAGKLDEDGVQSYVEHACPSCGSCSGMYTANSINCLAEAVGIALPGNGTIPAVHSGRIMLAKHAGMAIMNLIEKDIKARDIINEKSLRYYSSFELEPDNEFSQSSRLWKRFETGPYILMKDFTGSENGPVNYDYLYQMLIEGRSPCPEGYRVPNIREAAVMFSYTSKNWWANCPQTMVSSYVNCCYKYGNGYDYASTGNSTEKTKHSWDVQGNNQRITIGISGNCYRIRCVRDIPD